MKFIYQIRKMPFLKIHIWIAVIMLIQLHGAFGIEATDLDLILTAHNDFRRKFANGNYSTRVANMRKMEWNYILQLQAEREINCNMIATMDNIDQYDVRMNFGISQQGNISDIVNTWIQEVQHYIPAFTTCMYLQNCKHFMTMINSKHDRIGCATLDSCRKQNERVTSLLCLYEGGEMEVPPFKTGRPCTKCEGHASFCDNGLCVPCDTTTTTCDCRKTCHKRNVGVGHLDNSTCTCNCYYGMGPNCDEECVNPEMYVDWDPCEGVTQQDCVTDGEILREFCPENCACNKYPTSRIFADVVRGAALRNQNNGN